MLVADGQRYWVAVALAAAFLLAPLLTPAVSAQVPTLPVTPAPHPNYRVVNDSIRIGYLRADEELIFVDSNKDLVLNVTISNPIGALSASQPLRVVAYDRSAALADAPQGPWADCKAIDLDAGTSQVVQFKLKLPTPPAESDSTVLRAIVVAANVEISGPNAIEGGKVKPPGSTGCATMAAESETTGTDTTEDNTLARWVVVDRKLDLEATFSVAGSISHAIVPCEGATDVCPIDETLSTPYNRVEYDEAFVPADAPAPPGTMVANPSSRFVTFKWDIKNNQDTATWKPATLGNHSYCMAPPRAANNYLCTPKANYQVAYRIDARANNSTRSIPVATASTTAEDGTRSDQDQAFRLYGAADVYNFTLTLDPRNRIPEMREANQQAWADLNVRAPDLVGSIEKRTLRTDPKNPFRYDSIGNIRVPVQINVTNLGAWDAKNVTSDTSSGGCGQECVVTPFTAHIYLDKVEDAFPHRRVNLSFTSLDRKGGSYIEHLNLTGKDVEGGIKPGKHTLILIVDPRWQAAGLSNDCRALYEGCASRGNITESNELNNKFTVDFYVEDNNKPAFEHFKLNNVGGNGATTWTLNRSETAKWRINVTEDDEGASVKLFLKYPNGTVKNTTMVKNGNDGETKFFELNLPNGYYPIGTYKAWVNATDSAGNFNNSWESTLNIQHWFIQRKSEWDILANVTGSETVNPPDGAVFDQSQTPVKYRYHVLGNETGLYPTNRTDNKVLWHQYPTGEISVENPGPSEESCPPQIPVPGLPPPACTNTGIFSHNVARSEIGKHNVSVQITDKSGTIRYLNRSFTVTGPTPQINEITMPARVDAGLTVRIKVNVTSPEPLAGVFAVFQSNATSYEHNQTLFLTDGTNVEGNWTVNMTTGHMRNLTNGGGYVVKFAAVDEHGTWGVDNTTFTLVDGQAPSLSSAAVTPSPQEVNVPVTFKVRASDKTNFSVTLTITLGSTTIETRKLSTAAASDLENFTYTREFAGAGEYRAKFEAVDSVGLKPESRDVAFSVSENLPPRIEIKQPSYLNGRGERFGSATPRIQIFVSDRDELLEDSFKLVVNDRNVTLTSDMKVPSTNPPGYTVTYDVPASARFSHNTTVRVNFTATDNSTKRLTGFLPISTPDKPGTDRFRVDAKPPTSGLPTFVGDSYRELDTDVWNVSLSTIIQLKAEENPDGASTEIKSIRFNVLRNGQSQDFVYNEAEKITFRELFRRGVTNLGSGPYKIQYYAIDSVDNQEQSARIYDVYLDDLPPSPDLFATRPQGRFVNASWVDNHAGVARVVTWWKLNNGIYQPLDMRERNGIWQTTIPGGKSGDTICYYLQAWDRVNNDAKLQNETNPYSCYPVGNQIPTIDITEPGNNARKNGTVTIRWTASDPDREPLTFKIFYRLAGRPNFQELASLPVGSERYAFDTTKVPDGTYEIQVQTTDGNFVAFEQITLVIVNSEKAICDTCVNAPGTVRPGEAVLITALVKKAGATVEARIFRDGNLLQTVAMRDDGKAPDAVALDGTYSALVSFQEGGTYSVEIFARYEEGGQLKETTIPNAASFTVRFNPADVFSTYAGLWIAIAALVVACLGVGGYALFRRWKS